MYNKLCGLKNSQLQQIYQMPLSATKKLQIYLTSTYLLTYRWDYTTTTSDYTILKQNTVKFSSAGIIQDASI